MLNSLILQGRLTKEVINKNGNAYFSIAQDDYKGNTMFVEVVAFGKTAEYCLNYLRKGAMVIVSGALSMRKYEDKTYVSLIAREISSLTITNNKEKTELFKEEEIQAKEETPIATDDDIDIDQDDLPF